jgi:hypothetical protein
MCLKKLLLIVFTILISMSYSQTTISGTVVDSKTLKPIPDVNVTLDGFETVKSNSLGNFQIWNIPYGNYSLKANDSKYSPFYQSLNLDGDYKYVRIRMGEITTITGREIDNDVSASEITNTIYVRDTVIIEKIVYTNVDNPQLNLDSPKINTSPDATTEVPTFTLDDLDLTSQLEDEDDNISGILNSSRDPFYNTAAYTFGKYRLRLRGLDNANGKLLMNNIEMNDLGIGRPSWSQWGGLNDVTRNKETSYGLDNNNFAFGGLNGATNIDIRASNQRQGLKVSYALSNGSYMHRAMASYSSGLLKGGWAVSLSGSYRFSDNTGLNDKIRFNQSGTTYEAYSWFAGLDKKFGKNHLLSLNVFSASNKRGKNSAATQEAMDLAGSNYYNPNWGYQTEPDGKKYVRNAKVGKLNIPTAILMHDWKLKNNSSIKTSAAFRKGINGSSRLDGRNFADPRPDFYKNMPSYVLDNNGLAASEGVADVWRNNEDVRQIDWDGMYEANELSTEIIRNANGENDTAEYNIAKYILSENRYDPTTINFTSIYEKVFNDKVTVNVGFNYANQKTHNYQIVKDLLGADYFIDLNPFADRDFPGDDTIVQNDLSRFNRILEAGDTYGYDYVTNVRKTGFWGQTSLKFKNVDLFFANEVSFTNFWRTGNVQSGLFPNDSEGDSEIKKFTNFNVKGGATFKLNGRNYLFANASYGTRAPFIRNSMLSARTRNGFVSNLKSETLYSVEGGYIVKAPKVKGRIVGYAIFNEDQTTNRGVYLDDLNTFGTYSLTGVNTRNVGIEAAVAIEAFPGFTVTPVVAWGDHTYTSRPEATFVIDNSDELQFEDKTVYYKGLHLASGPQSAYSLGLNYRTSSYWFFSLNFSYFDKIYISPTPVRRVIDAVDNVEIDSEQWVDILSQERMSGQFVMDASIGKSMRLDKVFKKMKNRQYLNFNLNVGNLTNNTKFVTGGYEQSRFKYDTKNLNEFQNKYYYAYGLNFYAGVSYRF